MGVLHRTIHQVWNTLATILRFRQIDVDCVYKIASWENDRQSPGHDLA